MNHCGCLLIIIANWSQKLFADLKHTSHFNKQLKK